jgi:hypothetical protein
VGVGISEKVMKNRRVSGERLTVRDKQEQKIFFNDIWTFVFR